MFKLHELNRKPSNQYQSQPLIVFLILIGFCQRLVKNLEKIQFYEEARFSDQVYFAQMSDQPMGGRGSNIFDHAFFFRVVGQEMHV